MANLGKSLYEEVLKVRSANRAEIEGKTEALVDLTLEGEQSRDLREEIINLRARELDLHNLFSVAKSYFDGPNRYTVKLWCQYEGAMRSAIKDYERKWGHIGVR